MLSVYGGDKSSKHSSDYRRLQFEHDELRKQHRELVLRHSKFCLAMDGPKLRMRGKLELELDHVEKLISLKRQMIDQIHRAGR